MPQKKHLFPYRVHHQDIDPSQKMSLLAVGRVVLEVAGLAADDNYFGMDELNARNQTWVLSRFLLKMTEYPEKNDEISIETWIQDCSLIATTRNFRIYNAQNKIIGAASSLWSIINLATRRPINLHDESILHEYATGEAVDIGVPQKNKETAGVQVSEHRVGYSDLDFNRHVNSIKYVQWALDTFDIDLITEEHFEGLNVNYLHEAVWGERVTLWKDNETNSVNIISEGGKIYCKIHFYFK